jgi:hypothetical protein
MECTFAIKTYYGVGMYLKIYGIYMLGYIFLRFSQKKLSTIVSSLGPKMLGTDSAMINKPLFGQLCFTGKVVFRFCFSSTSNFISEVKTVLVNRLVKK